MEATTMGLPFKSGLPLTEAEKPSTKSVQQVVDEAIERRRRRKLERRFSSPSTPETRRAISRMIGEREDD
jgi:hypothetical protein